MVAPLHFGRNDETACDNAFMQRTARTNAEVQQAAQAEFDAYVALLRSRGVRVEVVHPPAEVVAPDGVFPNNWFSTHAPDMAAGRPESLMVLYPMRYQSRSIERTPALVDSLRRRYAQFADFSGEELRVDSNGAGVDGGLGILEGTGAAIIDHTNGVIYHALSERSHAALAHKLADTLWPAAPASAAAVAASSNGAVAPVSPASSSPAATHPRVVSFSACDAKGRTVYHTNVIMALGSRWAVLCVESIPDAAEAAAVVARLQASGRTVVPISLAQVEALCGNVLELRTDGGADDADAAEATVEAEPRTLIAMSTRAFHAFTAEQRATLEQLGGELLHTPLDTIEEVGGGGARCMLAEIF